MENDIRIGIMVIIATLVGIIGFFFYSLNKNPVFILIGILCIMFVAAFIFLLNKTKVNPLEIQ